MKQARIFALHGFTGSGDDFLPLQQIWPGDWQAPDLPGHGVWAGALPAEFSIESLIDRYASCFKTGARVGVGYSLGARLLLHLVLHKPQWFRALILISGSPGLADEAARSARRQADELWIQRAREWSWPEWLAAWQAQPVLDSYRHLPSALRQQLEQVRKRQSAIGLARSLQYHGQGVLPALAGRLSELQLPTVLVVGGRDEKYQQLAGEMAGKLPNPRTLLIPGAGHAPHWEAPDQLMKQLNAIDFIGLNFSDD